MVGMTIVSEQITQLFPGETIAPKAYVHSQTIGNGALKEFTIIHNFNTKKVMVSVVETADDYEVFIPDVEIDTLNTVIVKFAEPPGVNQYTVIVIGG